MAEPPRTADTAPAPGTPAWWAARSAPARPAERRRGRPPRSFESIVAAASDLVDEHGAAGVNMRRLADRLGTSTATLYRHVSGQEELLVHVVDRLLGEVRGAEEADGRPRGWQETLREIAFGYRRFLTEHPNVLPLLVGQLPIGPNAMAIRERSLAALTASRFPEELAARAFTTLLQFVVGSAVTQAGSPGPREAEAIADYYRSVDGEAYPHVASAADALTAMSPDEEFVASLEIVLDGIDRARRRRAARAT